MRLLTTWITFRYWAKRTTNRRKLVKLKLGAGDMIAPGEVILLSPHNDNHPYVSVGKGYFMPQKEPKIQVSGSFLLKDILL